MSALEQKLDQLLLKIDASTPDQAKTEEATPDQALEVEPPGPPGASFAPPITGSFSANEGSPAAPIDVQADFAAVRDSVQRVKLPGDLRLNESRTGIRREDQPSFNAIVRSARYTETVFKLLSSLPSDDLPADLRHDLDNVFTVNLAHIRYLQEEYSNLTVQGTFDATTSKIFRQLQRQSSGLSSEAVDNLHRAAGLAAAVQRSQPQQQSSSRPRWNPSRGRGRGRPFNSDYSSRGASDIFQQYTQRRPFPPRRDNYGRGADQ